jgi:hypothetical protein
MRDSYGEGVASHTGPESCGGGREVVIEALTGESAGWVWSSEILNVRDADALMSCGRPHRAKRQRELGTGPAESKTPKGGFASKGRLCLQREALPPYARTEATHKGGGASRAESKLSVTEAGRSRIRPRVSSGSAP